MPTSINVIIPVTDGSYVEKTVKCILDQDCKDIYIVVSDCSKDGKAKTIMNGFCADNDNIFYEHVPEIGGIANWQNCFKRLSSDSEYVIYYFEGDEPAPNDISIKMSNLESHPDIFDPKPDSVLPANMSSDPFFESKKLDQIGDFQYITLENGDHIYKRRRPL